MRTFTLSAIALLAAIGLRAQAGTETIQALRIVDWGQLSGRWQEETGFAQTQHARGVTNLYHLDLDGNPKTPDRIETTLFSLKKRLSPHVSWFDDSWISSIFYGGCTYYYYNRPESMGGGLSEFYNNSCETVTEMQPSADFAVHMCNPKNRQFRGYFTPIWVKENFPHLGRDGRVGFDKTSLFILNQQRHYGGYDGIRFVARNGQQFYVSEVCQENWQHTHDIKSYCPADVMWGRWNPKEGEYALQFDPATPMEKVSFDDVTAVGFYVFKDDPRAVQTAFKFEAFEVYATVTRSTLASEILEMQKVASPGVPGFYISSTEVSYQDWKKIFKWSESVGVFAHTIPGMIYDRNGDMGSMDEGFLPHQHDEPVTDMTIRDMLAWCNALSEFEGRDYVYYTDPACKPGSEYRTVILNPWLVKPGVLPNVYVKWEANGYRLPTAAEWLAASGTSATSATSGKSGTTRPVASGATNAHGIYGLHGNVWEPVWSWGTCLNAGQKNMRALGGSFAGTGIGPTPRHPADGSPRIGLRVVRRDKGLPKPPLAADIPAELVWDIPGDLPIGASPLEHVSVPLVAVTATVLHLAERDFKNTVKMPAFDMAKTETTYRQWLMVYDWALRHGYAFDRDGDMGSMYLRLYKNTHTAEEPVTRITYYDMLAWCNALSEMEGRKPVFYEDKDCTRVYRKAWRHRPVQLRYRDYFGDKRAVALYTKHTANNHPPGSWVYMDWSADGFRLPTMMEWEVAFSAGRTAGPPFDGTAEDHAWIFSNAGMRSHEVATKPPNAYGLHDLYGNVFELWVDSIGKGGGDLMRKMIKQTRHPIQHYVPYSFSSRWRACAKKTSFLHDALKQMSVGRPHQNYIGMYPAWGWPDTGFRVVRCKAGTYPPGGIEPGFAPTDFPRIDLQHTNTHGTAYGYDPLQGQCYRANLARTGIHLTKGLKQLKGVRWKAKTGGEVRSSPVVYHGVCYVGSADGTFYALDAGTGKQKWAVKTGGPVYSSACVYDGDVFFGSDDGCLYVVACATGAVRLKIRQEWNRQNNVRSSPAVVYGVVFVAGGTDAEFDDFGDGACAPTRGFDIATGKEVFATDQGAGGKHFASPAIQDGTMALMGMYGVSSIDLAAGMTIGSRPLSSASMCSHASPVMLGGSIFAVMADRGCVVELSLDINFKYKAFIDPGDQFKRMTSTPDITAKTYTTPVIVNDTMYLGSDRGGLTAIGTSKNGSVWDKPKYGWTFAAGCPIRCSASCADGVLYFGVEDGTLYALPAAPLNGPAPSPLWTFKTAGPIYSMPWPADGAVYVGSDDGYIYCLESK